MICSMVATRHDIFSCSQHALENEELTQHLGAAKDAQRQLTAEVRQSTPFSVKITPTVNALNLGKNPMIHSVHFLPPVLCLSYES